MESTAKLLTWAEIDLDAIAHNLRALKARVGHGVKTMAVVKANAYGHGAVPVAKTALAAGADWLAVNRVNEGIALREAGISARILVLGYCPPAQAEMVVAHRLTPAVTSPETAHALAKAASGGEPFPVHIKIDTGMGRLGLLPEEATAFVRAVRNLSSLRVEGVFSHFAVADEADRTFTRQQHRVFLDVVRAIEHDSGEIPIKHLANSAASMAFPPAYFGMVRLGIALYGLRPSGEINWAVDLHPAMTLKTRIGRVRTLPAGASVGYGRTFIAPAPTPVALAAVGYGDGYPRLCSNRGVMLVHGKRAPIAGRVSMDQTSLDVSGIENVREGDEVVVFGRQGDAEISADEVAAWAETINYEIVTAILPRVPRVYLGSASK